MIYNILEQYRKNANPNPDKPTWFALVKFSAMVQLEMISTWESLLPALEHSSVDLPSDLARIPP